jgi:hypothetical protein
MGIGAESLAGADERTDHGIHRLKGVPQDFVVCTGWHALCGDAPDCQVIGNIAYCDCYRVNETHIVATSEIQDPVSKRLTLARCTDTHPCTLDHAPVCKAIKSGQYKVDHVKYWWVSTYSYRGWCRLLEGQKACDPQAEDYIGDSSWAICDAAPCTEIQNPSDQDRPLSCQCRVEENTAFVGMNGSCTGDNSGIMSSMPIWAWDFENNTYTFDMPGYEYVQSACAPLASDPWPPQRFEVSSPHRSMPLGTAP